MKLYIIETQQAGKPWRRLDAYANEALAIDCAEQARLACWSGIAPGARALRRYDAVRVRRGSNILWRTVSERAS
jgi:hypothetical protein